MKRSFRFHWQALCRCQVKGIHPTEQMTFIQGKRDVTFYRPISTLKFGATEAAMKNNFSGLNSGTFLSYDITKYVYHTE
jgi:hypothetical protein